MFLRPYQTPNPSVVGAILPVQAIAGVTTHRAQDRVDPRELRSTNAAQLDSIKCLLDRHRHRHRLRRCHLHITAEAVIHVAPNRQELGVKDQIRGSQHNLQILDNK